MKMKIKKIAKVNGTKTANKITDDYRQGKIKKLADLLQHYRVTNKFKVR